MNKINEKRDDYIIFYIAEGVVKANPHCEEILEQRWFALDNLPEDLSPATKRKLDEYLGKVTISERW